MKKVLLPFAAVFFFSMFSFANPIYTPPVFFSELYWENDQWTIELLIDPWAYEQGHALKMKTSAGESLLREDLTIPEHGIVLITSDSLQQPLQINQDGDFLQFYYEDYDQWYCEFGKHCFGNYPDAEVSAAGPGQSIVHYYNIDYNQRYLTKSNIQTPGVYPNDVTSYGAIEGTVVDEEGYPVEGAIIGEFRFLMYTFNLTTDENGVFSTMDLMPMNYFAVTYKDDCIVHDTLMITIEPDSTTYVEIIADTCIVPQGEKEIAAIENKVELQVYPNPFHSSLTVDIVSSLPVNLSDAYVRVYDQAGALRIEQRINTPYLTDVSVSLENKLEGLLSGVYLLTFENAGQIVSSQKIVRN